MVVVIDRISFHLVFLVVFVVPVPHGYVFRV